MNGSELWVSDGTEGGTHLFKDILPGPGSSNPGHLHVEGNILLFSATDGIHSLEPWRSDGTVLGTRMLQDIAPGDLPSSPTEFTASGPYVYFAANDGTTGFELWALPRQALLATFADVPTDHWAWRYIEALATSGITGGCGQGDFCPDRLVTRAEAAIFLVRASHGPSFVPPPATGRRFSDIPAGYWAGPWIEQLAADGVTSGCGGGNFCPGVLLTRRRWRFSSSGHGTAAGSSRLPRPGGSSATSRQITGPPPGSRGSQPKALPPAVAAGITARRGRSPGPRPPSSWRPCSVCRCHEAAGRAALILIRPGKRFKRCSL